MNYYFSLVLALGITIVNSSQGNLFLDSRTSQNQTKSQLITQVTSTNVDLVANKQLASNSSELPVESAPKNLNHNLLLSAIAVTGIFSAILLLLLFKKVEVNLNDKPSDSPAENALDDTVIIQKPESLTNGSSENNTQSLEQSQLQDTVILPPYISQSSTEHQEQTQDTVIVPPHISPAKISTATTNGVSELIREIQKGDHKISPQILEKLSQSSDLSTMLLLVELITEADSQQRSLILEAMRNITNSILKPMNQVLILSLGDENSQVKQNAIKDLTSIYEVMLQVTERLSQTVNDSEQKLPETAQWALQQLKQMPETPTWQLTNLINNGKMITDNR